jgi:hypothetical protein
MNLNILETNIYYYENVLENPKQLIKDIEALDLVSDETTPITKWKEWVAYQSDYSFGAQKTILESVFDNKNIFYKESISIYNRINEAIVNVSLDYAKKHDDLNIGKLTPLSISKYNIDRSMGPHVDSHDDDPLKTISVVLYLNDNYEGGQLYFKDQDILIKPKEGSIVVFPSKKPYFHESQTLISGTKYMTPGFWQLQPGE